jgi:hypothetical protein
MSLARNKREFGDDTEQDAPLLSDLQLSAALSIDSTVLGSGGLTPTLTELVPPNMKLAKLPNMSRRQKGRCGSTGGFIFKGMANAWQNDGAATGAAGATVTSAKAIRLIGAPTRES